MYCPQSLICILHILVLYLKNMRNIIISCFLCAVVGCNSNNESKGPTLQDTLAVGQKPIVVSGKVEFEFANPVTVDSSAYIMYPLKLGDDTRSGSFGSSNPNSHYWNVAFYNVQTGASHLLDNRKMYISNVNEKPEEKGEDAVLPVKAVNQQIITYNIVVKDFNKDGKLTDDDPTYLFISDRNGYYFKQISPDDLDVLTWDYLKAKGKILMQCRKDSNHDGKFDNDDQTIPYIYDVKTGTPAKPAFEDEFIQHLHQLKHKQWPADDQ